LPRAIRAVRQGLFAVVSGEDIAAGLEGKCSPELLSLVRDCLRFDPDERASAEQLLKVRGTSSALAQAPITTATQLTHRDIYA